MPTASHGDITLHYERAGSGPPLLFVTGTGQDLRRGPTVLDAGLPFDLVAFDHRDTGRSSRPAPPYAMADYAADAVAVLDAVGWSRVAVVGVSFGGMVAQELVLRHPERVGRLALVCTSSGGAGGASYPLHELEGLPQDERLRTQLAISDTRYGREWQEAHPQDAAALLELAAARSGPSSAGQLAARAQHDTWDRLPQVAVPTLVAAGRYDGISPVANSEALASRIPGARLEVYEGGHLFLLQDPKAWSDLTAFLSA